MLCSREMASVPRKYSHDGEALHPWQAHRSYNEGRQDWHRRRRLEGHQDWEPAATVYRLEKGQNHLTALIEIMCVRTVRDHYIATQTILIHCLTTRRAALKFTEFVYYCISSTVRFASSISRLFRTRTAALWNHATMQRSYDARDRCREAAET